MGLKFEDFLALLKKFNKLPQNCNEKANSILALCPAHADSRPSLSVTRAPDGRALIHCHAGCSYNSILMALGVNPNVSISKVFQKASAVIEAQRQIEAIYTYKDENGIELFEVVRFEPKGFVQRRKGNGGEYIYNLKGVRRVLYRLPELVATPLDNWVFIVEGEKDVENIMKYGYTATTAPMGAGKWQDDYNTFFVGRRVIVVPDNDMVGLRHANDIAGRLVGICKEVKVFYWDNSYPSGFDVSDFLAKAGSLEQGRYLLDLLINNATPYPLGKDIQTVDTIITATDDNGLDILVRPVSLPKDYQGTDYEIASLFVQAVEHNIIYVPQLDQWYFWNGHIWHLDNSSVVFRLMVQHVKLMISAIYRFSEKHMPKQVSALIGRLNVPRINRLLDFVKTLTVKDVSELDNEKMLLVTPTQWWDLRTGLQVKPDKNKLITLQTKSDVASAEDGYKGRWYQFLDEMFGDKDIIDFIQRALGYSVTGDTGEQVFFMLYGKGANGKSTLLTTVLRVLGDYACNVPFSTFEAGLTNNQTFDLAMLLNKRLVTASETDASTTLNESRIKALTGGEVVTARRIYRDFFEFTPVCKIWLMSNHRPQVRDDSWGFWRRIIAIECARSFVREADKDLPNTLWQEREVVMRWLVDGATQWYKTHLGEYPNAVEKTIQAYRDDSDPLLEFIEDCIVECEGEEERASDVYKKYKEWAEAQGLDHKSILGYKLFNRLMKNKFRFERNSYGRYFLGLRLKL